MSYGDGSTPDIDTIRKAKCSMTTYATPYTDTRRWLRGNLHAHTSCGRFMAATESGKIFSGLGYDFLAITDHNQAPEPTQFQEWQTSVPLMLIPGEENGSTDHILEIGVHAVTPTGGDNYGARAAALQGGGGFVIGCHPQEYAHGEDNIRTHAARLDAFEIFNGLRSARGCDETRNVQLWDEVLTAGTRVWGVATDDFHCQYISPGHGWVCVQAPAGAGPVTWPEIVAQLKAGAFYASTYPTFEQLDLQDGQLTVVADRYVKEIRVIGPGGAVLHTHAGQRMQWTALPDLAYFRVEAICGNRRAWSQPFFAAD